MNDFTDAEEASGRANRVRTRLIVEGFANLALVAILFSGVQAQFISGTSGDNQNQLATATNAVFFAGLIFSVFTAVLATLSGRWFSILREDDSEYLSSRWLAQDCAEKGSRKKELESYLEYQIELLANRLKLERQKPLGSDAANPGTVSPQAQRDSVATTNSHPTVAPPSSAGASPTAPMPPQSRNQAANNEPTKPPSNGYNPIVKDLERIIKLLSAERVDDSNLKLDELGIEGLPKQLQPHHSTWREWIFRWILLSPLAVCVIAFLLFCAGILMLAWNRQPRAVAVFASATVLVCVLLLICFTLRHRHKHVIKKLVLARFSI